MKNRDSQTVREERYYSAEVLFEDQTNADMSGSRTSLNSPFRNDWNFTLVRVIEFKALKGYTRYLHSLSMFEVLFHVML